MRDELGSKRDDTLCRLLQAEANRRALLCAHINTRRPLPFLDPKLGLISRLLLFVDDLQYNCHNLARAP